MKKIIDSKFLQLDERKLSEQWMFWLSILIPLALSIILSIPLWLQTKINLSAEGYDNFLRIFKLPIGVLSLSIPLVAIVAHIHRTIQTAKQIELTNQKNITDQFFSHHKYIVDSLSSITGHDIKVNTKTIIPKISHPHALYRYIFPTSSYLSGIDVSAQNDYIKSIIKLFSEIEDLLENAEMENLRNKITNTSAATLNFNFGVLCRKFNSINLKIELSTQELSFGDRFKCLAKDSKLEVKLVIPYSSEDEFKSMIRGTIYLVNRIFKVLGTESYINIENNKTLIQYSMTNDIYLYQGIFRNLIKCTDELIFSTGSHVFSQNEYDSYNYLPKL